MEDTLFITAKFREIKNSLTSYLTQVLPNYEISPIMMYTLEFLRKNPDCIAVQIANEFGLTRGAVTQLLDKLEQQGLVMRMPHPTSRRSQLIHVTAQGTQLIESILLEYNNRIVQLFKPFDAGELSSLRKLLEKLPL
ncbi:MarR family winged helix-turn-helix transcriptional regulator [Paenibacillus sp. GCM10027628]|uniref:MarR family winged helix-turn-helix transcriptional regulator n=1 Tax=Paenibacillus sp. GCM10027628 TaxID=3273413 RepID=UPI003629B4CA